jgi:hypothetical protein
MSMTNEVISGGKFEIQVKKYQEVVKNTLWDSLFMSVKKQDKKEKV